MPDVHAMPDVHTMNFDTARANMIEQQVRPWDVLDQQVLDVFAKVPRDAFVSEQHKGIAYSDYQLPIGQGQHLLKPIVDGRLLQSLAVEPGFQVLEIGTGSGFLTACLTALGAQCTSLEIEPLLAAGARARLDTLGITDATILEHDASQPFDARDSYDAIAFGGAVGAIPDWYKQRMSIGGRLFAVVGDAANPTMEGILVTRISTGEWTSESLFDTQIDPLVNFQVTQPAFIF